MEAAWIGGATEASRRGAAMPIPNPIPIPKWIRRIQYIAPPFTEDDKMLLFWG